jgi:hypothetical protein
MTTLKNRLKKEKDKYERLKKENDKLILKKEQLKKEIKENDILPYPKG